MADTKSSVEADVSGITTASSAIVDSHRAVESSANKATAAINKMADAEARAQSTARAGARSKAHRKFDRPVTSGIPAIRLMPSLVQTQVWSPMPAGVGA